MSKTENKTENNTASVAAETAPYMKKSSQDKDMPESPKSNFVIPLVLLLVSAIVIVATFYQDEYKDLVADAGMDIETLTETPVTEASQDNIDTTVQSNEVDAIADSNIATATATATETAVTEAPVITVSEAEKVEAEAASTAEQTIPPQNDNRVASTPSRATNSRVRMQPAYTPYPPTPYANNQVNRQSYDQARKQAMAHAAARQQTHDEMMQQHRQAYEKEMLARRQQHEAAMKAQQEKRAKIAETQKAVFQRVEQNRKEYDQRMQAMHEEVSKMHDEIHKIMHETQPQYRNNSAPQIQQPDAVKLQSI